MLCSYRAREKQIAACNALEALQRDSLARPATQQRMQTGANVGDQEHPDDLTDVEFLVAVKLAQHIRKRMGALMLETASTVMTHGLLAASNQRRATVKACLRGLRSRRAPMNVPWWSGQITRSFL
jgi:hypothetical protein